MRAGSAIRRSDRSIVHADRRQRGGECAAAGRRAPEERFEHTPVRPIEPIMSLIRPAQWAGDGAQRRIESAGSESVMSRGILPTTALLRATMERRDPVVAGQLPASGDTEGSS
jgi:hypothetical protein